MKIFSVYDKKANSYSVPFIVDSEAQAYRSFVELVNDGQSTVSKFPSDFALYLLGDFDAATASFALSALPAIVSEASILVREKTV